MVLFQRIRQFFWACLGLWALYTFGPKSSFSDFFNYLSQFTVWTNILICFWFFCSATVGSRDWFGLKATVRLSITSFGLVTSIVYFAFLFGQNPSRGLHLISDFTLHLIIPAIMLLEWFFQRPLGRSTIAGSFGSIIVPVFYLVFTLIRGAVTGFYPYFFLDLSRQGLMAWSIWAVSLTVLVWLIALILGTIWNRLSATGAKNLKT